MERNRHEIVVKEKRQWIMVVCDLFNQIFGNDFMMYTYTKEHGTQVSDDDASRLRKYDHNHWEIQYSSHLLENVEKSATAEDMNESLRSPLPLASTDFRSNVHASLFPHNLANQQQDDVHSSVMQSHNLLSPEDVTHVDPDDSIIESVISSPMFLANIVSVKEPGVCTSAENNVLPNSSSNSQSQQTPAVDVSKTEAGLNTIQIDSSQMTSQECLSHQTHDCLICEDIYDAEPAKLLTSEHPSLSSTVDRTEQQDRYWAVLREGCLENPNSE